MEGEISMCKEQDIISSYILFKLIHESGEIDREKLKKRMKTLRNSFANRNQLIEFDFIQSGENVYSNKLNEIIDFGISADILGEKSGSVIYFLKPGGIEYLEEMSEEFDNILTPEFIKTANSLIHDILVD